MPVDVTVEVAEVLVRQSSGRHRGQGGLALGVGWRPAGPWGIALEAEGTVAGQSNASITLTQWTARPALLATLSLGEERARFEVAAGPALAVHVAEWVEPERTATLIEPCGRLRMGLAGGLGRGFWVVGGVGGAWGPSGGDYDLRLGARWSR